MKSKTIAIDFDGVIHSYTSGWQGAAGVDDPPVPGAIEFLRSAYERFVIVIFSSRASDELGRYAIRRYLERHGLEERIVQSIGVTHEKPNAGIYLDDRAWRFEGTFPDLDEIEAFRPWYKR